MSNLIPEIFDTLMDGEYPVVHDNFPEKGEYFEEQLKNHPDLLELRGHIVSKLKQSDYFSWRGGDEIEAFAEGFVAAAILLNQDVE